ncbi:Protein of unknown function DUF820 [Beggiatoa sp. PS]|nr:Protein of unknown function DUF820 [Beggiatoa sp. PS]
MHTIATEPKLVLSTPKKIVPPARYYEELITEGDGPLECLSPEEWPQVDHLVTEDDAPVDNFPSAKQQRLLVESLYNSWTPPDGSQFLTDANIGVFYAINQSPIVPDVFLSLDIQIAADWWNKRHRSYLVWELGKVPDVAIEIVSNTEGHEDDRKQSIYERMRVPYYVIFDAQNKLKGGLLRVYELHGFGYTQMTDNWLSKVGLGLTLWDGIYENQKDTWLRWYRKEGNLILTGKERAEQERQEKEQALSQLKQALAKLRTLGINPDDVLKKV